MNEHREPGKRRCGNFSDLAIWIALGVGVGAVFGVTLGNVPVGIAIGIAACTAIGALQRTGS